jgi:DNA-binding NarL/FixJ family response regulator
MSTYYVYVNGPQKLDESALTDSVFIAHDFFGGDERKKDDYRLPFRDAFSKRGYRTLFADEEAAPGTLLSTICQHIINTEIGIYDVTGYNANVLIELGLALGLNRPTLVIAKDDRKPLLDFLEEMQPLRYTSYPNLARTVVERLESRLHTATDGSISRTYCASCLHECRLARKRTFPAHEEYLVVGISETVDEDLHYNVQEAFLSFELKPCSDDSAHPHMVCRWVYGLRRSQVALFHLREPYHGEANAQLNIQVGIAAGIGTPWTLVLPTKQHPPTDLRGLLYVNVGEYQSGFRKELSNSVRALISSRVNNPGIYPPLPTLSLSEQVEETLTLVETPESDFDIIILDDNDAQAKRLETLLITRKWRVSRETKETITSIGVHFDPFPLFIVDGTHIDVIADSFPSAPVLVFTSRSKESLVARQPDLLPYGFLSKTASDEQILDSVDRILNGERLSTPWDRSTQPSENEQDALRTRLYEVPIEELDLSVRVFNSLKRTGITTIGDVLDMLDRGPDAMMAIRNFSEKSLDELVLKLKEKGYLAETTSDEESIEAVQRPTNSERVATQPNETSEAADKPPANSLSEVSPKFEELRLLGLDEQTEWDEIEFRLRANGVRLTPDERQQLEALRTEILDFRHNRFNDRWNGMMEEIKQGRITDAREFDKALNYMLELAKPEGGRARTEELRRAYRQQQNLAKLRANVERWITLYHDAIAKGTPFDTAQRQFLDPARVEIEDAFQRMGNAPELADIKAQIDRGIRDADKTQLFTLVALGQFDEILDYLKTKPEEYVELRIQETGIIEGAMKRDEAILWYQERASQFAEKKANEYFKRAEDYLKRSSPQLANTEIDQIMALKYLDVSSRAAAEKFRQENIIPLIQRIDRAREILQKLSSSKYNFQETLRAFDEAMDERIGWPRFRDIDPELFEEAENLIYKRLENEIEGQLIRLEVARDNHTLPVAFTDDDFTRIGNLLGWGDARYQRQFSARLEQFRAEWIIQKEQRTPRQD